jgi:hypothetical protein
VAYLMRSAGLSACGSARVPCVNIAGNPLSASPGEDPGSVAVARAGHGR